MDTGVVRSPVEPRGAGVSSVVGRLGTQGPFLLDQSGELVGAMTSPRLARAVAAAYNAPAAPLAVLEDAAGAGEGEL